MWQFKSKNVNKILILIMRNLKTNIILGLQLIQKRKQLLQRVLDRRNHMYLKMCEKRRLFNKTIVESVKSDYVLSIAFALLKDRKTRRFKSRPRSDRYWLLLNEPRNESQYFETMRMTKSSFQKLCSLIIPHLPKQKKFLTVPVPSEKQIAICLYKLASCAEYRVIGDVFGVHKSTVHKYFHEVLNAILKLTKQFIHFPKLNECLEIAKNFQKKSNIPNIIGAIDGKYYSKAIRFYYSMYYFIILILSTHTEYI